MTVELSATTFLDCGAIAFLLAAHDCAVRQHTGFTVTGATGITARVMRVTGVWGTLVERDAPTCRAAMPMVSSPMASGAIDSPMAKTASRSFTCA